MTKKVKKVSEKSVEKPIKRLRVQFDIAYCGTSGKKMSDEVVTVPDMHMTIQQLLEEHTINPDGTRGMRQPLYLETEIPMIRDITDVMEFKAHLEKKLSDVNDFIRKEQEEREKHETIMKVKETTDENSDAEEV